MTSIRQSVKRLLGLEVEGGSGGEPEPASAYRFYWTKQARDWTVGRRRAVRDKVQELVNREDFEPTTYERRYRVEGLDELAHAGASLQALLTVLEGFEQFGAEAEEET